MLCGTVFNFFLTNVYKFHVFGSTTLRNAPFNIIFIFSKQHEPVGLQAADNLGVQVGAKPVII